MVKFVDAVWVGTALSPSASTIFLYPLLFIYVFDKDADVLKLSLPIPCDKYSKNDRVFATILQHIRNSEVRLEHNQ